LNENPYLPSPPANRPAQPWPDAGIPAGAVPVEHPRRPRVWPIPVVLLASFACYITASIVAVVLAAFLVGGPDDAAMFGDGGKMEQITKSPLGLGIMLVFPQLAMAAPAVLAAFASPVPVARRLGLVRGNWPIGLWLTAAMGTPLVGMISSAIVGALLGESESLEEMSGVFRALGESGFLIPLALMVGITPGVCEELVFRGYVQTRLGAAWGAPLAIVCTSLVFAVFHMDLVHSAAVMALGVYLGWIAWASGSVLAAMLAHFVNNFLSVLAVVLLPEAVAEGVPPAVDEVPLATAGVLGSVMLISAVCLLMTLLQSRRYRRNRLASGGEMQILSESGERSWPS